MKEHSYLENYNDQGVIDFEDGNLIKIERFRSIIKSIIKNRFESAIFEYFSRLQYCSIDVPKKVNRLNDQGEEVMIEQFWFDNGINCELLNLRNQEWKKGKIHISINVDFYPDEPEIPKPPESPLDDIRELMNKDK